MHWKFVFSSRRRHTRYWRDWSSDVCSSDLHNCKIKRLDHTQEQGLVSVLPLGVNKIEIDRGLTSSSTAVFMPFTTEELFINSSNSLYYGLNALSHNLIMAEIGRAHV